MDVREKLVKLICDGTQKTEICTTDTYMDCKTYRGDCGYCTILADHLMANGVTVQEWISVKEHLPQENDPEGTVCELVQVLLVNGDVSTGWCNRRTKLWWHFSYGESDFIDYDYDHTPVIAWQPLAQPPKGE